MCNMTCWFLSSIGAIAKVVFSDLDLLFKGQIFQMLISRKMSKLARKKCNMAFVEIDFLAIEWRHCETSTALLLLYFFKVNISNVNISDTLRASAKSTTFIDFDICHRMTQLRKLYSVT